MGLFNMWKPSPSKAREVYEMCSRSVVKIDTVRGGVPGYGSGFVWDRELLVTCHHVISDASDIRVTFEDGTSFRAQVVLTAENWDVALLRVDAAEDKLWPITAGDSDMVHVGDGVCAIGAPFGYQNSLSTGVISQVKHPIRLPGISPIEGAFQTDAALNPGSSGGPLIDRNGRVIGMNATIEPSISHTCNGVGFAIPVNIIKEVVGMVPNYPIGSLPDESDTCCIELPEFVNGEGAEESGRVHVAVSSTVDTKPSSGIEFSPPSHVKQEHCHLSHHHHTDIIECILEEASHSNEIMDIIWSLEDYGKYKMHNGDVLLCRGKCEECGKMDLDILTRVDKIEFDHIHGTPVDVNDRFFRELYSAYRFFQAEEILNDTYDNRWETTYEKALSYPSGSILRNKSAPKCLVDQLHIVNDIIDQLERDGKVKRPILRNKLSPYRSLKRLDARPLLDLNDPGLINDPAKKESLQRSQLEKLLKSFICCCPPTSSRKTVSCTEAATTKSSNPGSSSIKCC